MSKKNKNKKIDYHIDERSTRKTFDEWLNECGNDLSDSYGVLSFSGSDGEKITDEKVGKAHFNRPDEVEAFLIKEEAYKKQKVMCGMADYNPPTIHYIDWFNKHYPK